ncbi:MULTISPECIES: hypothetical protein [Aquimarina]|uniref:Uncharacterized protein n=1 Tax=Aquimarina algiphila TaxID=2047982 RepID=A0A554VLA9_9FLAO|nr:MULTISPECIES: hypothetical protein [Aquimarina]TSE08904.1 hypothetical protein FOF46_10560 [Aquimarina algiphila]
MKIAQRINKIAIIIAITSFILGTILLLYYSITQHRETIEIGMLYVQITFVINAIVLITLILNAIINYKRYKENLITILLISLNIPIVYVYIMIAEVIYFG